MAIIGIVAGGVKEEVPPLKSYDEVNFWIGVDKGNTTLFEQGITPNVALGDFDSIDEHHKKEVFARVNEVKTFPEKKDETDLEIAIKEAIELAPSKVLIFQATGGRKDHEWVNILLLRHFAENEIDAWIINQQNELSLKMPGQYTLEKDDFFPYISFLSISETVSGLTLNGFKYNLSNEKIELGSSLTVSNEWNEKKGTYLFESGILLVIKSRDLTL